MNRVASNIQHRQSIVGAIIRHKRYDLIYMTYISAYLLARSSWPIVHQHPKYHMYLYHGRSVKLN